MKFLNNKENFDSNTNNDEPDNYTLDDHEYKHQQNIPHNHAVHTHDAPESNANNANNADNTTNSNNENDKEDFRNIYIYMQYLLITLIPIFILLILSHFGVISQSGAAIIILAILVIVMMFNYRTIYNNLNDSSDSSDSSDSNQTRYHRHDSQGRMMIGHGGSNDLQVFDDPYYNPNNTNNTNNRNNNSNSGSGTGVICSDGRWNWEHYLDRYSLLKNSSGQDIEPKNGDIRKILIKYTKEVNDGTIQNPVEIDEIELFKVLKPLHDADPPISDNAVYNDDDGMMNLLTSATITVSGSSADNVDNVNKLTDLSFNNTDVSFNVESRIVQPNAWYPGYTQINATEEINLELNADVSYSDLYALAIYTPNEDCLDGIEVEIQNRDNEVLGEVVELGLNGHLHLIKFGASGDFNTIKYRFEPTYDSNRKVEYNVPSPPLNREQWALQHYQKNRNDGGNNVWNCPTENFENLNETNKKQGTIMTMFSKEDLPKQLEFNTQFYSELTN